jgi:hypothetical protein
MERDDVPWNQFVVVDHFPVGVSYQGPYLQTLILVGCRSGTTRKGVLGRGLLTESAGPLPLGELLGMSWGSPAWARGTNCLMVVGALFMSFTHHDLQKESKRREWDHDRNARKQEVRVLRKIND